MKVKALQKHFKTLVASSLIGLLASGTAWAETELKAAVFVPVGSTWSKPFEAFAEHVNDKGKGQLQIRLIGPEAIPYTEQPNALRSGLVDIMVTPPGSYKSIMREVNAQDLSNMTLAEQRASGGYDALNDILRQRMGAFALTTYGTGVPFHLYSTQPVTSVDQLKGMRVRTQPLFTPFFKDLGLSVTTIAVPEVYTALERNVIQGYGFALWGVDDFGWQEMTKIRIDPGFYNVVINVVLNERKWKSLSEQQRNILSEAATWFESYMLNYTKEMNEKSLASQQTHGIQTVNLGEDFTKRAYDLYWKEIVEQNPKTGPALQKLLMK